jgi:hypothetical protein
VAENNSNIYTTKSSSSGREKRRKRSGDTKGEENGRREK